MHTLKRLVESSTMAPARTKLILWTGKKHSGKTTSAAALIGIARDKGFCVAGLLAKALYRNGRLIGFDGVDLRSEDQAPLARRRSNGAGTCPFSLLAEGVRLGDNALGPAATESADLVIVDEFGPLEMNREGWRRAVDLLIRSSDALILLVVRQELARRVQRLYANVANLRLAAAQPESIDTVISILEARRQHAR